jgi:hypothetical protein
VPRLLPFYVLAFTHLGFLIELLLVSFPLIAIFLKTSLKKPTKPGEGAVEKNQLKKSPLRRLARSS